MTKPIERPWIEVIFGWIWCRVCVVEVDGTRKLWGQRHTSKADADFEAVELAKSLHLEVRPSREEL